MRGGVLMTSPGVVKDYLRLSIGLLEHEVFVVLFMDAQHRLLVTKKLFSGKISQTSV